MRSLIEGLRASGNGSAASTVPNRRSIAKKSSGVGMRLARVGNARRPARGRQYLSPIARTIASASRLMTARPLPDTTAVPPPDATPPCVAGVAIVYRLYDVGYEIAL